VDVSDALAADVTIFRGELHGGEVEVA